MESQKLIENLFEQTEQMIRMAEKLKTYAPHILTWKENNFSWNILECLEHLNLYGDFYLYEIQEKIKKSTTTTEVEFRSGILGNYFSRIMKPTMKLNKMKTLKSKNPLNLNLDSSVIDKFMDQQKVLLNLLIQSKEASLNKTKIKTSISHFINLRLGDTFQFLRNHNLRHFKQIETILLQIHSKEIVSFP